MKNLKAPNKLGHFDTQHTSLKYELKKYALLATGIFTLGMKKAKGAILYTDVNPDIVGTNGSETDPSFQVDVDGGGNDFGVGFYYYYYYYYYYGNFRSNKFINGVLLPLKEDFDFTAVNTDDVISVPLGSTIGPASTWGTGFGSSAWEVFEGNGFPLNTDAYAGIRMNATGGGTLYGWIRVELTDTEFILKDYAYNTTPDQTIEAGQQALPIELIEFTVRTQNNQATLSWTTATELDNYGFAIERSADGRAWNDIGFVPGNGTTQIKHEYAFTDDEKLSGLYYYRLRQIDQDQTFEYTPIRTAQFKSVSSLDVYPNPVSGNSVNLSFNLQKNATVNLYLFDAKGQMIRQTVESGQKGVNQIPFEIGDLDAGVYFVRMQQEDGEMIVKRVVVQ